MSGIAKKGWFHALAWAVVILIILLVGHLFDNKEAKSVDVGQVVHYSMPVYASVFSGRTTSCKYCGSNVDYLIGRCPVCEGGPMSKALRAGIPSA